MSFYHLLLKTCCLVCKCLIRIFLSEPKSFFHFKSNQHIPMSTFFFTEKHFPSRE